MKISKSTRFTPKRSRKVIKISQPRGAGSMISLPRAASSSISQPRAAGSRIPYIYRVHRYLRNVNKGAYEPEVIAIGPYHRGKAHLKMMEDHKLRYWELLIERKAGYKEKMYANVGKLESEARKCYANKSFELAFQLDESKFIEMLVLDGCFIVELVRKFVNKDDDLLFQMGWIISSLQRDLMLFENQLPFFVLCEVFDVIEGKRGQHSKLMRLLSSFFSDLYPGKGRIRRPKFDSQVIMHLLDLIHRSWQLPPSYSENEIHEEEVIPPSDLENEIQEEEVINPPSDLENETQEEEVIPPSNSENETQEEEVIPPSDSENEIQEEELMQFISNATALKDANVKFKMEEKKSLFDVEFKDGVMVMAPLHIEDRTECFLRNLIAHEQYFCQFPNNFVTDYVRLLDCLINSAKDVELLKRKDIITNYRGDDEVVANMANTLRDSVTDRGNCFSYAQIFEDVNQHCRKPRNTRMAKLRQNYLHSPWAIISIVVGAVLLLLTVTQTLFTILQVVGPKK